MKKYRIATNKYLSLIMSCIMVLSFALSFLVATGDKAFAADPIPVMHSTDEAAEYVINTFISDPYSNNNIRIANFTGSLNNPSEVFEIDDLEVFRRFKRIRTDYHTGIPNKGDYIGGYLGSMTIGCPARMHEGIRYGYYSFNIDYKGTAEQEIFVTQKVEEILTEIDIKSKNTDYERVKAIYEYICRNIRYDEEEKHFYIHDALIENTTVCNGFSQLMYRMLLESGVDCRTVYGEGFNGTSHAWNIVKIGNLWYGVDVTRDARAWAWGDYNIDWMLLGSQNFEVLSSGGHVREDKYNTPEYTAKHPMSSTDFKPGTSYGGCTHNYSKTSTVVNCNTYGYSIYTCSKCKNSYRTDYTLAAGHSYTNCRKGDEIHHIKTCSRCGADGDEEAHTYSHLELNGDPDRHVDFCEKCLQITYADHVLGYTKIDQNSHKKGCTLCSYSETENHVFKYTRTLGQNTHTKSCRTCDFSAVEEHSWGQWTTTKPATEDEPGIRTHRCTKCNATEAEELPRLPHKHNMVKTEAVDPTCTQGGNLEYWTCIKCEKVYSDEAGIEETTVDARARDALGHNMSETEAVAPTCTEAGNKEYYTCTKCNKVYSDEAGTEETTVVAKALDALGHNMSKTERVAPTCTDAGNNEYYTCLRCNKVYKDANGDTETTAIAEIIDLLRHEYGEWSSVDDEHHRKACTRCGVEGEVASHSINHRHREGDAELHEIYCSECDYESIEEHELICVSKDDNAHANNCKKCGFSMTEDHEFECTINDQDTHTKSCASCDYSVIEDHELECSINDQNTHTLSCKSCDFRVVEDHPWGEWTEIKPATEEEAGSRSHKCTKCNATETEELPRLPHTHNIVKTEAVDPTCTQGGNLEYWTCTKCEKVYNDEAGIEETTADARARDALGHNMSETEAVVPTCTTAGNNEYYACSRCNKIFKDVEGKNATSLEAETLSMLGHDYGDWSSVDGEHHHKICARCGVEGKVASHSINHRHREGDAELHEIYCSECDYASTAKHELSCATNDQDTHTKSCALCNYSAIEDHEFECSINDQNTHTLSCKSCEFRVVEDHHWGEWTTKSATEDEPGSRMRRCMKCNATEAEDIPKLPPKPPLIEEPTDFSGIDSVKELEEHIPDEITPSAPAPAAALEALMLKTESEDDVKGSAYLPLKFQSKKQKKSSITLNWNKVSGADQYVIYGNLCNTKGKKYKMVKIATVKSSNKSYTVKKIDGKKLKKGTYYKFVIVAQKGDKALAASKTVHVATTGNKKKSNYTGVSVDKKIIAKAKKLKKGASLSLKAKPSLKKGSKAQSHIKGKLRYESSKRMIATVSKNGKIKAKKKGTCYIYAYNQSGIPKKIKVTVKN